MNIEEKIRNNREAFDDVRMPEGSRERFLKKLSEKEDFSTSLRYARNDDKVHKLRFMTWTSVAAAAITILMVVSGLINNSGDATTQIPQNTTADNKLIEMRQMYDARMDQAIFDLENVMQNVDDSTRMQINSVIDGLLNMGDVFAELAPLPEEKQMAIAEQIYDNKLRTLELLTDKLNK